MNRLSVPDDDGHTFHFLPSRDDEGLRADFLRTLAWVEAEFGPGPVIDGLRQAVGTRWCYKDSAYCFWFRDEADAMHFKLRWC